MPDNNTVTDDVTIVDLANLSITKTHTGPVRIGDDLTFTLDVANAGPSEARDVVVTDPLPTGLAYVSAAGTDWTCAETAATVECSYATPLAAGATAPPITLVVTVGPEAYPSVDNVATVTTSTTETDATDNQATDTVTVPAQVDLAITKTHTADFAVGSNGTWTLEVSNLGPTDDPGPVTVTDDLPVGTTFVSGTGTGVTCSAAGQLVTCTLADGVTMTDPVSIALVVAVQAEAFPSVVNTVTVSTPSEDLDPTNNTATDPVDVFALSKLAITKDVASFLGTTPVYRIVVTNLGPNATTTPIIVTDALPAGLTYVAASGAGWTCNAVSNTVTCTYAAVLAVNQAAPPIQVTASLTAAPGTKVTNVATATGGQPLPCPDCSEVLAQDDATVTAPQPSLSSTGTDSIEWALLVFLLLSAGVLLVLVSRRRTLR